MSGLLRARGVSFPRRLHSTDLGVDAGQLVCLVGPNGSGKTSLLHAVAGIGDPAGEVLIDGISPRGLAPEQRMRLYSYLPASRDLTWPISGRDLIALGLPAGDNADAIIDDLQLGELVDRRVDRLSTGERSRILLARALAPRPRLLLLDEPTSNLDPLWQIRLMERLQAMTGQGHGAIVAVHDLDLAARYADRLIVMNGGKVVADAPPQTVIGSAIISEVFGIERANGSWRALSSPEDRQSSP